MIKTVSVTICSSIISFLLWSFLLSNIPIKSNANNNVLGTNQIQIMPSMQPSPSIIIKPTFKPSTIPISTATPKPTPLAIVKHSPTPITIQQLEEWFTKYANKESVNIDLVRKIAKCESNYNPLVINGPYWGLYQFSTNTWISTRTAMNLDTDPNLRLNAEESIKTAAFRLATQGNGAWPNCGK